MNLIDNTKPLIENAATIANIFLGFLGVFAVFQFRESIMTRKSQEKQEKMRFTEERINQFGKEILHSYTQIIQAYKVNKVQQIDKKYVYSNQEAIKAHLTKEEIGQLFNERKDYMHLYTDLLNNLNVFSIYFMNGFADEAIGLRLMGKEYCEIVESFAYEIAVMSKQDSQSEAIKLYQKWSSKLDDQKLIHSK